MPTLADLAPALTKSVIVKALNAKLAAFRSFANDATGPETDVRLYVDIGCQSWWVNSGDVQFDTVHGDLCGASCLWVSMVPTEVADIADDLLNQVHDQYADFDPSA